MEIENFNNNSEDVSMNGNSLIIDVITDNFMTDVIEQSKETPVIVDFWAPWCEPCKQLTPIIERIIKIITGTGTMPIKPFAVIMYVSSFVG